MGTGGDGDVQVHETVHETGQQEGVRHKPQPPASRLATHSQAGLLPPAASPAHLLLVPLRQLGPDLLALVLGLVAQRGRGSL